MRRQFLAACLAGSIPFAAMAAAGAPSPAPLAGGFASAPTGDAAVVEAAAFAVQAQRRLLREASAGKAVDLKLIAIVAAQQQVVAGMNYKLVLRVRLNGHEKRAEATVWRQAWRKPEPCRLTSWIWR